MNCFRAFDFQLKEHERRKTLHMAKTRAVMRGNGNSSARGGRGGVSGIGGRGGGRGRGGSTKRIDQSPNYIDGSALSIDEEEEDEVEEEDREEESQAGVSEGLSDSNIASKIAAIHIEEGQIQGQNGAGVAESEEISPPESSTSVSQQIPKPDISTNSSLEPRNDLSRDEEVSSLTKVGYH